MLVSCDTTLAKALPAVLRKEPPIPTGPEAVDAGGAGVSVDSPAPHRRSLLAGAVVGAAVAAGASLFGRVGTLLGASSRTQDVRVLRLALRLEYTEAASYAEALANGILSDDLRTYAEAVVAHEEDHVRFLRQTLGSDTPDRPRFDFGRATRHPDAFTRTAIRLADVAVAGYNGQATNLTPGDTPGGCEDRLGRGPARRVDRLPIGTPLTIQ